MTEPERAWVVAQWLAGMNQAAIARMIKVTPGCVSQQISKFCWRWAEYDVGGIYDETRREAARMALDQFRRAGLDAYQPLPPGIDGDSPYQEHAWLLRAEGLTFREIAERLGVSGERARQLVMAYGKRVSRAINRPAIKMRLQQRFARRRVSLGEGE